MAVGQIFRSTYIIDAPQGTEAHQVKYVRADSTIAVADYGTLMDNIRDWWDDMATDMGTVTHTNMSPRNVEIFTVDDATGQEVSIGTRSVADPFGGAGDMNAHGIAALATARVVGGRGVAKTFWPGIQAGNLEAEGGWDGGMITDLASLITTWLTGPAAVGGTNIVPITWNDQALTYKVIGNVGIASNLPAYQRRRKPGVGV